MQAVKENHPSILRQAMAFLTMLLAVMTLFCVGHTFALEVTVGDFTVTSSRSGGTTEYNVSKYNGHTPAVTLPDPTVEYQKDPAAPEKGTFKITGFSDKVFSKNSAITSVVIPEGYTEIPSSGFANCTGLESVTIPGSLTGIYANAFENCTALTTVTFQPDTAASLNIKNAAFTGCTALESVQLPARLSDVMNDANFFYGCSALTEITVAPGGKTFFAENGLLYRKNESGGAVLVAFPFGKVTSALTLPAEAGGLPVVKVGGHMFRKNADLTEVTVPASVTGIGLYAFEGCSNLTTVNLLTEEALTLDSACFENLAMGSNIYVGSETARKSFIPVEDWEFPCYTEGNTVVSVKDFTPAPVLPEDVSAVFSIKAAGVADGKASFDLYVDSASCLSTAILDLSYDSAQLGKASVAVVGDVFIAATPKVISGGVSIMLNQRDNVLGYTGSEPVKVATVTMPVQSGVTGELSVTLSKANVSGINDVNGPAVKGTATFGTTAASVFVAGYDINGDGTVDQVDITEAQRYYQVDRNAENWNDARKADVNNDGKVDLQDLVELFLNLTDF